MLQVECWTHTRRCQEELRALDGRDKITAWQKKKQPLAQIVIIDERLSNDLACRVCHPCIGSFGAESAAATQLFLSFEHSL